MDVIRSESERSRFLADYLSVLKEFFNFLFNICFFSRIIFQPEKNKIFEKF